MRIFLWMIIVQFAYINTPLLASFEEADTHRSSRKSAPAILKPKNVIELDEALGAFSSNANLKNLQTVNQLALKLPEEDLGALDGLLLKSAKREIVSYILKDHAPSNARQFRSKKNWYRNIILYCSIMKPKCAEKWPGIHNFISICACYKKYAKPDEELRLGFDRLENHYAKILNQVGAGKRNRCCSDPFSGINVRNVSKLFLHVDKYVAIYFLLIIGTVIYIS